MTQRRGASSSAIVATLVVAATTLFVPGCNDGPKCWEGAFVGSWVGPASYTATSASAPSGLSGSGTIAMSTRAPYCADPENTPLVDDGLTFKFAPGCSLPGTRTSTRTTPHCSPCGGHGGQCCTDYFVEGTASTTGTCELPLATGTMKMDVQDGTVHVLASGALDVTLSGTLLEWDGKPQANAYVTMQFARAARDGI